LRSPIFKVSGGSEKNDRNSAAVVKARRRPLKVAASTAPSRSVASNIRQYEILVRLAAFPDGGNSKQPNKIWENSAVPVATYRPQFNNTKRGQKRNRTVRAVIPRLVWRSGSRGSITPVDVSQTIKRSIVRESVWRFSRRQMPGILPGGGRM